MLSLVCRGYFFFRIVIVIIYALNVPAASRFNASKILLAMLLL